VLILNALSHIPCSIENLSDSDDTRVMEEALTSNARDFNVGAAGTAMRFLTALLARTAGLWTLTGSERMKNRPVKLLVDALNSLGAHIVYTGNKGYPPLRISGRTLRGGEVALEGGVSSQYISALLMIAPLMEKGLTLRIEGPAVSAPYINLTIELMRRFGAEVERLGNVIRVLPREYTPIPFTVEPDWSAASYWYAIAALATDAVIRLPGLRKDSLQGDAAVAGIFACLGVETEYSGEGVCLRNTGDRRSGMEYDFVNEPDLAQTLAVACTGLGIPFRFTGLQSLKIKETDRIEAIRTELLKLGYPVITSSDSILEWDGGRCGRGLLPVVSTYEDHRMAMAFAPLSLAHPEGIGIADTEVVTKSYPAFWNDLQKAGFEIAQSL
jgi:3-phosphoshikimate 1-carboxyvinyltransferase